MIFKMVNKDKKQRRLFILHIDGEKELLDLIKLCLDGVASVKGVGSFNKAKMILNPQYNDFDMIICELYEKRANDGIMFVKELRDAGFNKPIVALTMLTQTTYKYLAMNNGVTEYLTKPFDAEVLSDDILRIHLNYIKK